ncbi:MAG: 30S ribosomal protein S8 [Kiritimatiellia bacterium]|nr:30S ribosomal protein S8 [Kiritimatiellia bacterium]
MSLSDPIADCLTRIRNASTARQPLVRMPHSALKADLARLLKREGYVADVSAEGQAAHRELIVYLRYMPDETPVLRGLRRVSRPGRRVYAPADRLPRVQNGIGAAILTTSSGMMTDRDARRAKVGGEVICHVW